MNPIAVYSGSTVLYWSAVIISVGLLAALFMSCSVQLSSRGRLVSMLLFFPLAILFSLPLCRALHWYCHQEQYGSLLAALTNYTTGSYVLSAAIPGVWLAAWLAAKLDDGDTAKLLDAAAPGIALAVAFIRLSSLFNSSCRSKIPVTTGLLQHLPLASGITNSAGVTEYRFATFFAHFLLMLLLCHGLLRGFHPLRLQLSAHQRLCQHCADPRRGVHAAAAHPLQPPVHPGKRSALVALVFVAAVDCGPGCRRLHGISGSAPRQLVSGLLRRHGLLLHSPCRHCLPAVPELLRQSCDRRDAGGQSPGGRCAGRERSARASVITIPITTAPG